MEESLRRAGIELPSPTPQLSSLTPEIRAKMAASLRKAGLEPPPPPTTPQPAPVTLTPEERAKMAASLRKAGLEPPGTPPEPEPEPETRFLPERAGVLDYLYKLDNPAASYARGVTEVQRRSPLAATLLPGGPTFVEGILASRREGLGPLEQAKALYEGAGDIARAVGREATTEGTPGGSQEIWSEQLQHLDPEAEYTVAGTYGVESAALGKSLIYDPLNVVGAAGGFGKLGRAAASLTRTGGEAALRASPRLAAAVEAAKPVVEMAARTAEVAYEASHLPKAVRQVKQKLSTPMGDLGRAVKTGAIAPEAERQLTEKVLASMGNGPEGYRRLEEHVLEVSKILGKEMTASDLDRRSIAHIITEGIRGTPVEIDGTIRYVAPAEFRQLAATGAVDDTRYLLDGREIQYTDDLITVAENLRNTTKMLLHRAQKAEMDIGEVEDFWPYVAKKSSLYDDMRLVWDEQKEAVFGKLDRPAVAVRREALREDERALALTPEKIKHFTGPGSLRAAAESGHQIETDVLKALPAYMASMERRIVQREVENFARDITMSKLPKDQLYRQALDPKLKPRLAELDDMIPTLYKDDPDLPVLMAERAEILESVENASVLVPKGWTLWDKDGIVKQARHARGPVAREYRGTVKDAVGHVVEIDENGTFAGFSTKRLTGGETTHSVPLKSLRADVFLVPKEIDDFLDSYTRMFTPQVMGEIEKAFVNVTGRMKGWMLATPGTVLRNIYGMFFQNYGHGMDIVRPSTMRAYQRGSDVAGALHSGNAARIAEVFAKKAPNTNRTVGELFREMEELAASERVSRTAIGGVGGYGGEYGGVIRDPAKWRLGARYLDKMRQTFQSSEVFGRFSLYYFKRTSGVAPLEAAEAVRHAHFDYTHGISAWEQRWLRGRLGLFYMWPRKNIPLQIKMFMRYPQKYARVARVVRAADEPENEEQRAQRPMFLTDIGTIGINNGARPIVDLPFRDLSYVTSLVEAYRRRETSTFKQLASQLGSQMHPLLKGLVEKYTEFNQFQQRHQDPKDLEMLPPTLRSLPDFAKKKLGFVKYTEDGKDYWLVNESRLNFWRPMLPILAKVDAAYADDPEKAMAALLSILLGIKYYVDHKGTWKEWAKNERKEHEEYSPEEIEKRARKEVHRYLREHDDIEAREREHPPLSENALRFLRRMSTLGKGLARKYLD